MGPGTTRGREGLYDKLANVDLVEPRIGRRPALGPFIDNRIHSRPDLATNTVRNLSQSRRYRTVFFGADRQLHKITGADADAFGPYMLAKYAKATSARVIKHARQFFKSAIWAKFISENLFLDVRAGSMEIENRIHFVSREVAEKLIEAAPSLQWRVIIALSR